MLDPVWYILAAQRPHQRESFPIVQQRDMEKEEQLIQTLKMRQINYDIIVIVAIILTRSIFSFLRSSNEVSEAMMKERNPYKKIWLPSSLFFLFFYCFYLSSLAALSPYLAGHRQVERNCERRSQTVQMRDALNMYV